MYWKQAMADDDGDGKDDEVLFQYDGLDLSGDEHSKVAVAEAAVRTRYSAAQQAREDAEEAIRLANEAAAAAAAAKKVAAEADAELAVVTQIVRSKTNVKLPADIMAAAQRASASAKATKAAKTAKDTSGAKTTLSTAATAESNDKPSKPVAHERGSSKKTKTSKRTLGPVRKVKSPQR